MRNLTQEQKMQLTEHIAQKPIKYIELYNELYDHYASAYERGKLTFPNTLVELDEHFHDDKIEAFNAYFLSKTKKTIRSVYWSEIKNFWKWPQILTTLGILVLAFISIKVVSMEFLLLIGLFPVLIFIFTVSMKGYFLGKRKSIGHKSFKSAHHKATEYYQQLPLHIFNMTVFFPLIVLGPLHQKIHFYEQYPIIVFTMLALFLSAAYIGLKVYKTKIKVQYL